MFKKIAIFIFTVTVIQSTPLFLSPSLSAEVLEGCNDIADKISHGGVIWTENAVVVQGTASPGLSRNKNLPLSVIKSSAQRAATLDAYRKIAAFLAGVRVTSENLAGESSKVVTEIQAYVRKAKICKTKYYADGGVDMVVMVPLSCEFSMDQLSDAGTNMACGTSEYTGLVIEAIDLSFAPALVPRFLSPSGNILFSQKNIDRGVLLKRGAVIYGKEETDNFTDIIGLKPLYARAIGTGSISPGDLVLDSEASDILKNQPLFLREGRVLILIKAPPNLDCKGLLSESGNYIIDWKRRFILASGKGKVDFERDVETATRIRMLERSAEVDAQNNLLKAFSSLRVYGQKSLNAFPDASRHITGVVINAIRCDARFYKDGTAEFFIAAPMDGIAVKGANLGSREEEEILIKSKSDATGVIIDSIGMDFKPVLAPRLYSSADNSELYGPNSISKAYADYYGVAGYHSSIIESKSDTRIGTAPIVIKAMKVSNEEGVLIIGEKESETLRRIQSETDLLKRGRVVILTENTVEFY